MPCALEVEHAEVNSYGEENVSEIDTLFIVSISQHEL